MVSNVEAVGKNSGSFESNNDIKESADLSVNTSNYVYIRCKNFGWIPARVEKSEGDKATVTIPNFKDEQSIKSDGGRSAKNFSKCDISLTEYPNNALPLQNVDEDGRLNEVEDMVDLPFLHEAAIMYNLKARHVRGKPYTRTGDIVIACNPYRWMMDLYTERQRSYYASVLVFEDHANELEGSGDPRSKLEPHVYEASSLAYRGLAVEGENQSILVSGESGAGKTETVKILMSDLASVQQGHHKLKSRTSKDKYKKAATAGSGTSPIVQRVLDSNPLLEAFGNAKTLRNDNSSRFGKYIQLQFDAEDPTLAAFAGRAVPTCILAGSKCEVYLLEKSRVVSHEEEEERTYHIFYQLLAAPEEQKIQIWEGLEDTDNESFTYVGWSDTDSIEDRTDEQRFQHTVDSLALVGVEGDRLTMLMRVVCVVLQLGNLTFEPHPKDDEKTEITSSEDFQGLADLIGIDMQDLSTALLLRTVRARNEEYKVPQNHEQAQDSCNAFAKEIYAKTFLWLVRTINDATCAEKNYDGKKKDGFGIIGLLDIFGFESFETNRFEQLCINYANEKLQQKFTQDIFRSVQAEYEYEGIELGEITYDDNTDVLDLVEGRMGLLSFLNEECVRPKGSDSAFVSKVHAMNKENPIFIIEAAFRNTEFGIVHYAGEVIYDATNFVTKNMDTLPSDLQDCATKSSNEIISTCLTNEAMINKESAKKGKKRPAAAQKGKGSTKFKQSLRTSASQGRSGGKRRTSNIVALTVWTKFKDQLSSLMDNLSATRTRYIRCIKPNQIKKPLQMQHVSTLEQLRCAGVVAAVTISRSAFPNRLEHELVLDRFKPLWRKGEHPTVEEMNAYDPETRNGELVDKLLTSALEKLNFERDGVSFKAFVIGKSRTYFRAGALEYLEAERLKYLAAWAVEIQRIVRGFVAYSIYQKIRKMCIVLQSLVRQKIALSKYRKMRYSVIKVQCWYRCINASRTLVFLRRKFRATLIQTRWRMTVAIKMLKKYRTAAIIVQAMIRGAIQRPKYVVALKEKKEEAKLENQLRALQRKLEEAEARRVEAEKKAEERARKAIEEYRETATKKEEKESASEIASSSATTTAAATENPSIFPVAPPPAASPSKLENAATLTPHESTESGTASSVSQAPSITVVDASITTPSPAQITAQQQTLMDESGKMLEYLRKEVFKLRSQNAQMRTDFDLLKDNNQRLMDANASAGASFAALNQHAKQLSKTNAKLANDIAAYKQQIQKQNVLQVELKEELKMKQATYIAEVHSRLQYQKALSKIVDMCQDRCRDTRLVEDILSIADDCESEYMAGGNLTEQANNKTSDSNKQHSNYSSGANSNEARGHDSNPGLLSRISSYWS